MRSLVLVLPVLLAASLRAVGQSPSPSGALGNLPHGRARLKAKAPTPTPIGGRTCHLDIRDGCIVGLTNKLTGERLVLPSGRALPPVALHRLGEAEMRAPSEHAAEEPLVGASSRSEETATWYGDSGAPRARLRTSVVVEPHTGDALVTQQGEAAAKGLYGVSWTLGDIPDPIEVLVPGMSGQRFGPGAPPCTRVFDYPMGWEAPFVLLQGKRGGVIIQAADPEYRFKNLTLERSHKTTRLQFETRNMAPFEPQSRIVSSQWRITAYRGNWQVGAEIYRRWAQKRYAIVPLRARRPAWARDIQFVCIVNMDVPMLTALASRCDPKQTLLYVPGWRRDGYDRNYPDYTPAPEFVPFVREAHRLGFRVMAHVNYFGCDPKNPLYTTFRRWQFRDPFTKELQWWLWDRAEPPIKFAYVNPASSEWRKLFVARMVELCGKYGVDALHLDQTLCAYNDDNGLIDGMSPIEGNAALHRELRQALPEVAISGEGLNEVTCLYEQFAQRHLAGMNHATGTWSDRMIAMAHPISSAILTPYTRIYGYLGLSNPDSGDLYTAWQQGYEHFGVIPTFAWPEAAQLEHPSPYVRSLMERARFFQKYQPAPDFETPWRSDDLFAYRLNDGRCAFFRRDQGVVFGVRGSDGKETILYRRLEGREEAEVSGSVPGWPLYDSHRIIGLNPERAYLWRPEERDSLAPHLAALPRGYVLAGGGINARFARFRLETAPTNEDAIRLWDRENGVIGGVSLADGWTRRYDSVAFEDPSGGHVQADGESLAMHPPWKATDGHSADGARAGAVLPVTFVEYTLTLPDRPRLTFEAGVHIDAAAAGKSDGVTFAVICRTASETIHAEANTADAAPKPLALDLTRFRGQRVRLRIAVDPGPAGSPSFDWARVDRPSIITEGAEPGPLSRVDVVGFPTREHAFAADGDVTAAPLPPGPISSARSGARTGAAAAPRARGASLRLHLPNTLIVPIASPFAVSLPCDLLRAPVLSQVRGADGFERPGYSYFRTDVADVTSAGVRRPALQLHPPPAGATLADYWMRLPQEPAHLVTAIGIRDGSKSHGVRFTIEVNGWRVFERITSPGEGWIPVDVDMSPWRGKPALVTFSTSAKVDYTYGWAAWAEPHIAAQ